MGSMEQSGTASMGEAAGASHSFSGGRLSHLAGFVPLVGPRRRVASHREYPGALPGFIIW
ncbi:hypothetical protein ACVLD2_000421 [Paenibacillus sp. PvR052]|nr:hypothetical protein [Paenibacillus sp. PvR098]MBP2439978.1 hypothetical protein [Paenibacillus sp. PvP052]